jgi:transcriptional regulator with XRE-family HTH domain
MNFGDVLRELLEERDVTQKRLATDLNIAPSTIGSYVHNNSEPDFKMLKQIAEYFGISIDYLLDHRTGYTATHEEDEILRIFRSLTAEQRIIFTAQGKAIVQHNTKGEKISKIGYEIQIDNKK